MSSDPHLLSEAELLKQIQSVDFSLLPKETLLDLREALTRNTTKFCPKCLNSKLLELRSQNVKICNQCDTKIPWFLEKGQKSL